MNLMKEQNKERIDFKNIRDLPTKITDAIGSTTSLVLHSIFFVGIFTLRFFGYNYSDILLFLTTVVSLEAIYLAIFIQMTVNRNTQSLQEVEEDIDEIQEDVEGMEKDIDEIQEDVEEMEKDIDEIQEDIEETTQEKERRVTLEEIEGNLKNLLRDIDTLKKNNKTRQP